MSPGSPWERLARIARQAPPPGAGSPPPGWTAATARSALRIAALGRPTWWRVMLARLGGSGSVATLTVMLTGAVFLATWLHRANAPVRLERRYEAWSAESLRQLKQWYPLSCEDAGDLNLLLDRTLAQLRTAGAPDGSNAVFIITNAQHRIASRLTPAEQEQFAAQQAALLHRHLGWPASGRPPDTRKP